MLPKTVGAQTSARAPRQRQDLATTMDAVSQLMFTLFLFMKFYPCVQTLMDFFKLLMPSGPLGAPGEAVAKRAAEG